MTAEHVPEAPAAGDRLRHQQRFTIIPEWVLDADVSAVAVRLYGVLARYGNTSGACFPSRAVLAQRLRRSVDSVDRALRELEDVGAVRVERRRVGGKNLRNVYELRISPPGVPDVPLPPDVADRPGRPTRWGGRSHAATRRVVPCPRRVSSPPGGRTRAATRPPAASRSSRTGAGSGSQAATGSRTSADGVAAPVRPDPESSTQTPPPPGPPPTGSTGGEPSQDDAGGGGGASGTTFGDVTSWGPVLRAVGLDYGPTFQDVVERVAAARCAGGKDTARWGATGLIDALRDAVLVKHWPADRAVPALLHLAADRATASPMRLGCPGPWWDHPDPRRVTLQPEAQEELQRLETLLDATDGRRPALQAQARERLHKKGLPVSRLTVARAAAEELLRQQEVLGHDGHLPVQAVVRAPC